MRDDQQNKSFGGNKHQDGERKTGYGGNASRQNRANGATGGNKAAFGERRGFSGGNGPRSNGGKPSFGGERKPFSGDRKPVSGEFKPAEGEKRFAGGERKPFSGDRKPYSGDRKPYSGDKKPFGGERKAFDGEKRPRDGEKKPFGGEKHLIRDEKPGFGGKKIVRQSVKPAFGGDKVGNKPYGRPARPPMDRPRREQPEQQEGLPARRLALEVIRAVTERDAYISLVLDEKLHNCGLPLVDRRLAARLAYDTIENLMYLDHAIGQVMAKEDTDIKLRNILRMGACQLLLEDRIPESAACNTSVVLCKELGMEGLAGVCNGILRNLIRQKETLSWPDPAAEPVRALAIRHSVPEWLVERLLSDWGEGAVSLMSTRSHDSYITVRPNLTRMDDAAFEAFLKEKVWEHEPGKVAHSWRVRNMAEIAHDAGFVGGKFSIQSESSMMAAMAVAPRNGMQILDCCAAPGGKTCLMAEMMGGTGRVHAWELHAHRTDLIAAQAKRLGLENVRPMNRDAAKPRPDLEGTMDAVLLDAPCSGLGVMADKPDVKYRVTEESVRELVALQSQLLDTIAPYVKRGGTLVYSTCSVLKDENVRQAEAFLARHPEFELMPLPDTIPEEFRRHEGVGLQLLPDRDGVEGFYICRMRRKRV